MSKNDELKDAIADVVRVHRRGVDGMLYELEVGLVDDGEEIREMTAADRKGREGRIANAYTHRYEVLKDGKIVEIELRGDAHTPTVTERPSLVTNPKGLIAGGAESTKSSDDE